MYFSKYTILDGFLLCGIAVSLVLSCSITAGCNQNTSSKNQPAVAETHMAANTNDDADGANEMEELETAMMEKATKPLENAQNQGKASVNQNAVQNKDEYSAGNPAPVAIVYSKNYSIDLGGLERFHPFDIHKYAKIIKQLKTDKILNDKDIFQPNELSENDILRVQSKQFLASLKKTENVVRYLEADVLQILPIDVLNNGVLKPFRFSAGGTVLAAELAIKTKSLAINVGGGYHHAKRDKGEGFCIYADIPIAIRKLQAEKKIKRALVIDVDAHQGNGTVECLGDDDTTFCFSIHQGNIYPQPKEVGDLDIELQQGDGDDAFLEALQKNLPIVFEKANPDIVFVVGGCDPLAGDPLAGLTMTIDGIIKRDQMVVEFSLKKKVPVIFTLAGGYSKDAWNAQHRSMKNLLQRFNK